MMNNISKVKQKMDEISTEISELEEVKTLKLGFYGIFVNELSKRIDERIKERDSNG